MTTSLIDELDESMNFIREEEEANLYEIIFDFAREIRERMVALEKYYVEKGEETIELISRLNGMYQMSGINILEEYLTEIAYDRKLDILLRLEAGKALLSYKELEDEVEEGDTIVEKEEKETRSSKIFPSEVWKNAFFLQTRDTFFLRISFGHS